MKFAQMWLAVGAFFGGSGVLLGAFGAHALRGRLTDAAMQTWQTAVSYQLIHALALILVGILLRTHAPAAPAIARMLAYAGMAFAIGVICFSGSLYLLTVGGPRWLGPVTPLGGMALIAGWATLAYAAARPFPVS